MVLQQLGNAYEFLVLLFITFYYFFNNNCFSTKSFFMQYLHSKLE